MMGAVRLIAANEESTSRYDGDRKERRGGLSGTRASGQDVMASRNPAAEASQSLVPLGN